MRRILLLILLSTIFIYPQNLENQSQNLKYILNIEWGSNPDKAIAQFKHYSDSMYAVSSQFLRKDLALEYDSLSSFKGKTKNAIFRNIYFKNILFDSVFLSFNKNNKFDGLYLYACSEFNSNFKNLAFDYLENYLPNYFYNLKGKLKDHFTLAHIINNKMQKAFTIHWINNNDILMINIHKDLSIKYDKSKN